MIHGPVPRSEQLAVEKLAVRKPDVGERSTVLVHVARGSVGSIETQAHQPTLDKLPRELRCCRTKGLVQLGAVYADETNTLAGLHLQRVAIDHPCHQTSGRPG